ncbi:MAG: hypothetical protein L0H40_03215 [Micrococcaceae bacterium]|nr:hypothetical protein [Micrococcaceae bacterium]
MSRIPDREPRLDATATSRSGVPREELSGLAIRQPYRSVGPWLSLDAQRLVGLLGPRSKAGIADDGDSLISLSGGLGAFERRGQQEAIGELVSAELATQEGKLSSGGLVCTTPLRQNASSWRITTQLRGRTSVLQLWFGTNERVLLLAGPSAHQQLQADPELAAFSSHAQLDYIAADETAAVVTSWLGLGPSWFRQESVSISRIVYDQRALANDTDIARPDGVTPELWESPWLVWQIEQQGGQPSTFVNASAAGHYQVRADSGRALLERVPARNVYRHLVKLFSMDQTGLNVG